MDVHFHKIYLVLAFNPTSVEPTPRRAGNTRGEERRGEARSGAERWDLAGGLETAIPPRNNSTFRCFCCGGRGGRVLLSLLLSLPPSVARRCSGPLKSKRNAGDICH